MLFYICMRSINSKRNRVEMYDWSELFKNCKWENLVEPHADPNQFYNTVYC